MLQSGERRNIQRAAVNQRGKRGVKGVAEGGQRQKDIHLHELVDGRTTFRSFGTTTVGICACAVAFSM